MEGTDQGKSALWIDRPKNWSERRVKRVFLTVNEHLFHALQERATANNRSMAQQIKVAVRYYLKKVPEEGKLAIECPHPQCQGMLKIDRELPGGAYECICKTIKVDLEWTGNGPTLRMQ